MNITKNSQVIFSKSDEDVATNTKADTNINRDLLTVDDIIEFANVVEIKDVKETLDNQITMNQAISEEGIKNKYGASIGQTILKHYDENDIRIRAKALASAGSDARMSGCAMPVVTNSGSGNQGLTVSIPVIEFAKHLNETDERLYRALVVSNLISVLQKNHIGKLSAFCGAVCAATGAATGIAYLYNYSNEKIADVITNTLCIIGGMVCDGAKPSCAAKIAQAIDCALFSFDMMSKENQVFQSGDGLVKEDIEKTIDSIGRMAKMGMERTDLEILNIMIDK